MGRGGAARGRGVAGNRGGGGGGAHHPPGPVGLRLAGPAPLLLPQAASACLPPFHHSSLRAAGGSHPSRMRGSSSKQPDWGADCLPLAGMSERLQGSALAWAGWRGGTLSARTSRLEPPHRQPGPREAQASRHTPSCWAQPGSRTRSSHTWLWARTTARCDPP